MPWWAWLALWVAVAAVFATLVGRGLVVAEAGDWRRRGCPDRRQHRRTGEAAPRG